MCNAQANVRLVPADVKQKQKDRLAAVSPNDQIFG
jgi:hypothetical protein